MELGWIIRISSLRNKIDQGKDILATACIVMAGRAGVDRMRVLESWGGICPNGTEMWRRWRLCLDYIVSFT